MGRIRTVALAVAFNQSNNHYRGSYERSRQTNPGFMIILIAIIYTILTSGGYKFPGKIIKKKIFLEGNSSYLYNCEEYDDIMIIENKDVYVTPLNDEIPKCENTIYFNNIINLDKTVHYIHYMNENSKWIIDITGDNIELFVMTYSNFIKKKYKIHAVIKERYSEIINIEEAGKYVIMVKNTGKKSKEILLKYELEKKEYCEKSLGYPIDYNNWYINKKMILFSKSETVVTIKHR